MADEAKKNVTATLSTKDETKVYVQVPSAYEDTKAAVKALSKRDDVEKVAWAQSMRKWSVTVTKGADRNAIVAGVLKIGEAEQAKFAEGRVARDAEKEASKLSPEEVAAKRAATQAEMNTKRVPVRVADVKVGDKVQIGGAEKDVAYVGTAWTLGEGQADKLNETFGLKGKAAFEDGEEVAYAWSEVPQSAKTKEAEAPEADADETPAP